MIFNDKIPSRKEINIKILKLQLQVKTFYKIKKFKPMLFIQFKD